MSCSCEVAEHLLAAGPALGVLAARGVQVEPPGEHDGRTAPSASRAAGSRASNDVGSSIAISAISWSRWFWITSRAAPMPS